MTKVPPAGQFRTVVSVLAIAFAAGLCGGCATLSQTLAEIPAMVPELGSMVDDGAGTRKIVIKLEEQKAYLYRDGEVVGISRASTGREGYGTPPGSYRITEKDIDHRSSVYGAYVKNGTVVKADVNTNKDPRPPGAKYVGAPMPYFMRFTGAIGMHAGHVPGYPASHGCIRLPQRQAKRFYDAVRVGTPVIVTR